MHLIVHTEPMPKVPNYAVTLLAGLTKGWAECRV